MKAVILTANKNENFFPFSETRTKSMIPCSGNFLLGRLIQQLKTLSVTNICIVVGYQKNLIQGCFEYGQKFGVELHYEIQKGKGIGNALLSAEKYIAGEKFLLVYGDILTTNKHVLSFKPFLKENSAYSIASITHPFSKGSFGNVYLNHHMQITKITETPARTNQLSNYILSGMYLLQKDTFEILKEEKENIGALFQRLIKEGKFYANLSEEDWIDISYPWNIMDANRLVMKSWDHSIIPASTKIKNNVNIKGIVRFGENCVISSGCTIQGPCYIGDNTFIGNNCLIRDHTSIASDCLIGFGTEIKSSILFSNVLMGRLSFIGDSVIGENVQIGNYCTTINYDYEDRNIFVKNSKGQKIDTGRKKIGSFVGDEAYIGSNHSMEGGLVVKNKKVIPSNISLKN